MKGNEGHWGGEISIISQNFSKSPSILLHPLESSISQTSPEEVWLDHRNIFSDDG
jgi:RNA binding exosome subunit